MEWRNSRFQETVYIWWGCNDTCTKRKKKEIRRKSERWIFVGDFTMR